MVEKPNGKIYADIWVTFTNNSNDTLRYYSMSCAWGDFYHLNSDQVTLLRPICQRNVTIIDTILPKDSKKVYFKLILDSPSDPFDSIPVKIGYNFIVVSEDENESDFKYSEIYEPTHLIWSNEIKL